MTVKDKVIAYLKRCKYPKSTKTIAEKTECNYNTLRRVLMELYDDGFVERCSGSKNQANWFMDGLSLIVIEMYRNKKQA